MATSAKYVHTNLVAKDWKALANFYERLFGCSPMPPERDLSGGKLEAGTGLPGAHLRGVHLRLLAHDRRKIVHFNVTEHPTAEWTARQLVQAFYDQKPPRYLIRDRDGVYGSPFEDQLRALEIEEVIIAPRSPWQSPYVERVIGTLRRECLDHVVVLSESHLRRIVRQFLTYYHGTRTHLALDKDAPEHRSVQPSEIGTVIEIPQVGGLHHRYERRAA